MINIDGYKILTDPVFEKRDIRLNLNSPLLAAWDESEI